MGESAVVLASYRYETDITTFSMIQNY